MRGIVWTILAESVTCVRGSLKRSRSGHHHPLGRRRSRRLAHGWHCLTQFIQFVPFFPLQFDGPGEDGSNILAHTFYPNYQMKGSLNGDIHLDDFEHWHVNGSKNGASFPHVLVHEIGHTLGLGHSKKQQAIMFPIYRKEHLDLMQLDMDDK